MLGCRTVAACSTGAHAPAVRRRRRHMRAIRSRIPVARGVLIRVAREDAGMTTAEYAVGTVAVAGLGGLLIKLLSSDEVRNLIWNLISNALSFFFGG